ncbi:ELWxxDGT repeat protein [Epilithonimonas mollis]|uniref:Por secretion system C-terminal sorting domain-containing protein n=1 Tax=Epilithonimonas mollis TaxID=216903 RepID=A0A1M6UV40_9FLAO|nr:ELWxxDGT repeat protein [Epilithonimonas mollis]SHK73059.1 Por secretion system C-terminal sorting domain-containing protein [Epilithonimonas mollis]
MKNILLPLLLANLLSAQSIALLKDINPGANPSTPAEFLKYDGKLYFSANNGSVGSELWATDGTSEGTDLVADLNPGTASSIPNSLMNYDNQLYFVTLSGTKGLYSYDTNAGVTLKVPGMTTASNFMVAEGKIFFRQSGKLAYYYQGTITEIDTPVVVNGQMGAVNGKIITGGSASSSTNNLQLYAYDGTTVSLLKVINTNTTSNPQNFFYSSAFNTLFFTAGSTTSGFELWKTDGTADGTVQVKNINAGTASSFPGNFKQVGNKVFFAANNGTNGNELWTTDGTEEGTMMLKDINPGSAASNPNNLTVLNDKVYFLASDGSGEARLWESDGTAAGTKMTLELKPGYTNFVLGKMEEYGGNLYLSAKLSVSQGQELYKIEIPAPNLNVVNPNKKTISIYPNPTSGKLFFRGLEKATYDLYDVTGTVVKKQEKIENSSVQLNVPKGNYILVTKAANGSVNTNKIIVK